MSDKDLIYYIDLLGLTNDEFAKYIDISIDTLKTWLYRNNKIPDKKVDFVMNKIKLHPNYTNLKNETGKGEILNNNSSHVVAEERAVYEVNTHYKKEILLLEESICILKENSQLKDHRIKQLEEENYHLKKELKSSNTGEYTAIK
jgi:Txe/YoeB family toxin of Txe-Axe toxin-antitoxin module